MLDVDKDWQFIKEMENVKVDSTEPSWNKSRIEAFKQYTANLGKTYEIPMKVTFKTLQHNQTGKYALQVTATTSYGTLGVNIPYTLIEGPDCSKNLPDTLLRGFVNSFKLKIEKEKVRIENFKAQSKLQPPVVVVELKDETKEQEDVKEKKNGRPRKNKV